VIVTKIIGLGLLSLVPYDYKRKLLRCFRYRGVNGQCITGGVIGSARYCNISVLDRCWCW